jgi:hypothetical protein
MTKAPPPKSAPTVPPPPPSQRARALFAEWMAKTGDVAIAAERAGVSERTGRRWKNATGLVDVGPLLPGSSLAAPVTMEPTKFVGR